MAKKKKTDMELLELGKKLQQFYETGYIDKKQALFYSFLKGIAAGFGGILGATIVVAILVWILGLFNLAVFDRIINALQSQ